MHACHWRKQHTYAAKDDSRMTPGPDPFGHRRGRQLSRTKRAGASAPACLSYGKVGWLLLRKRLWRTGWKVPLGQGGDPMQKHPLMQQRRKHLSQVSSYCVSALPFSPLLSAAEASPHCGHGVQHHPACSETLGCPGAQCILGGKAGKNRRKREERGKCCY